jgi:hypothetical protein
MEPGDKSSLFQVGGFLPAVIRRFANHQFLLVFQPQQVLVTSNDLAPAKYGTCTRYNNKI